MRKKLSGRAALLRVSEIFDIPAEAGAGAPRVTITGDRRVHIENHRGLLEYGPETIVAACPGITVRIRGAGLEISAMSDMELVVTGRIAAAEIVS